MKLRCLVVDDEPLAVEVLESYIERIPFLHLEKVCDSAVHALDFLAENKVELMFLDIQMPGLTGIQLLRVARALPAVVLTTAYSEFALEAFELDVVDYLQKPIPFERMLAAVNKARQLISLNEQYTNQNMLAVTAPASDLYVKSGQKIIRVTQQDILFIEGMKEYVLIRTAKQDIKTFVTIRELLERLSEQNFIRVHRSFIVALNKIDSIDKAGIWISDKIIPVGDLYRDSLLKRIL
jgi:DNA-binding LytR/AlgR family response regulator